MQIYNHNFFPYRDMSINEIHSIILICHGYAKNKQLIDIQCNRIKTQHSFGTGSRETIFIVASPDDSVDVYHDNGEELLKIFDLLFHLLHHSLQIVQPLVGQHYTPIVIWHVFKGIGISWILQLQTNFWMVVAVIVKEMMIIMIIKMENNKLRR